MKRRRFLVLLTLATLAASFVPACTFLANSNNLPNVVSGSGNVVTETREVSGFDTISLQGMGNVIIDQNGSESLVITADDNFLPYLKTEVRGHTLHIESTDDAEQVVFSDLSALTFHVSVASLEALELAGAGSIEVNNLDTDRWQVFIPGAGSVTVSGRTTVQTIEIEGAGNYNAEDLASQEATVRSSGAGLAVVRVSDKLNVTIDGLGSVQYIGNPAVTQEINGLGTVSQRE